MTADLIILMGTDPSGVWHYALPNESRVTQHKQAIQISGEGGIAQDDGDKAALSARGFKDVCVIISGQSVRMMPLQLPQLNAKKLSQKDYLAAAGYALEDDIGGPISQQHLVVGGKGAARVAVISRNTMDNLIGALDKFGFDDVAIYADFDALSGAGRPLALTDRIIHTGALGYTLDAGWGAINVAQAQDPIHNATHKPVHVSNTAELLQYMDLEAALNLRQNDYAPRKSFGFSGHKIDFMSLAKLAALAALCGFSWLGYQASQARALSAQTDLIQTEMRQIYSEFTGKPAPRNPALAASRAVQSGLVEKAGFMDVTQVLFDALPQTDGIILESLRYDKALNANGSSGLSLRFIYPSFESATELESAITKVGGVLEAGGIREQGGQLIGDAVLRKGGAP